MYYWQCTRRNIDLRQYNTHIIDLWQHIQRSIALWQYNTHIIDSIRDVLQTCDSIMLMKLPCGSVKHVI